MLSEKQIKEIRGHLEKAERPVFFYDNDADGLCSFLQARRFTGVGEGHAVRGEERDLPERFARRAEGADIVFVFDVYALSKEFVDVMKELDVPVIWVDHHPVDDYGFDLDEKPEKLLLYKPTEDIEGGHPPISYEMSRVVDRKEDLWVSMMGCVADYYLPSFSDDFIERWPDFWATHEVKTPFDVYYGSEIGEISQVLGFGLKAAEPDVKRMQEFLVSCSGPEEVLGKGSEKTGWRETADGIRKRFDELLEEALETKSGDLVFFVGEDKLSMSSILANKAKWLFKEGYVVIGNTKSEGVAFSMRGKGVKAVLGEVLKDLGSGRGGGHPDAVGAFVPHDKVEEFRELLQKEVG